MDILQSIIIKNSDYFGPKERFEQLLIEESRSLLLNLGKDRFTKLHVLNECSVNDESFCGILTHLLENYWHACVKCHVFDQMYSLDYDLLFTHLGNNTDFAEKISTILTNDEKIEFLKQMVTNFRLRTFHDNLLQIFTFINNLNIDLSNDEETQLLYIQAIYAWEMYIHNSKNFKDFTNLMRFLSLIRNKNGNNTIFTEKRAQSLKTRMIYFVMNRYSKKLADPRNDLRWIKCLFGDYDDYSNNESIKKKRIPKTKEYEYYTPLQCGFENNYVEIVELMLKYKGDTIDLEKQNAHKQWLENDNVDEILEKVKRNDDEAKVNIDENNAKLNEVYFNAIKKKETDNRSELQIDYEEILLSFFNRNRDSNFVLFDILMQHWNDDNIVGMYGDGKNGNSGNRGNERFIDIFSLGSKKLSLIHLIASRLSHGHNLNNLYGWMCVFDKYFNDKSNIYLKYKEGSQDESGCISEAQMVEILGRCVCFLDKSNVHSYCFFVLFIECMRKKQLAISGENINDNNEEKNDGSNNKDEDNEKYFYIGQNTVRHIRHHLDTEHVKYLFDNCGLRIDWQRECFGAGIERLVSTMIDENQVFKEILIKHNNMKPNKFEWKIAQTQKETGKTGEDDGDANNKQQEQNDSKENDKRKRGEKKKKVTITIYICGNFRCLMIEILKLKC